uniref:ATP synthase subunit a n=1 Tax=Scolia bicincta TaxID=427966 RepID=A0A1L2D332_9HYME|nr:ATP synthase F0 subunit 6 [Scolia bicincta]
MNMDLFMIFDPNMLLSLKLNWMSMIIILMIYPFTYWFIPSRLNFLWMKMYLYIMNELIPLIDTKIKMNLLIFINLFIYIMINNIYSIFPYIFCASSHMVFSFSLCLPLWVSLNLYSMINNFNYSLAHYVPLSTPLMLISFMILIETISNIIRPLTLSIRLSANLTAGHLILSLIGLSFFISKFLFLIILIMQTLLFILELSVSFIQSYVFSVLMTLYFSEIK